MRSALFFALLTATGSAFALSCGETIERDTRLETDLDCPEGTAALRIARDGVVLDLAGHTLSGGSDTIGIELEGAHRVGIRGPGRIEGFIVGVEATRSDALSVQGVSFRGVGDGVRLHNAAHAEIAHNHFETIAGHAVAVLSLPYAVNYGGGHAIHDNVIADSEYGVMLYGWDSGDSRIAGNRFEAIGTYAIQADRDGGWNRIEGNDIGDVGVYPVVY